MTESKKNNKSTADKFTSLFDNDWNKSKSTLRTKFEGSRKYDPVYSWEGRRDDPKEFTRMEATIMPLQSTRPIVLSGNAVVGLEESTGMEVLNSRLDIKTPPHLPLTQEQRDVGMSKDLSGKIPMVTDATRQGKFVVLDEPLGYKNQDMRPAVFKTIETPKCLLEAGPQCDKKLLTPAQRREIAEFEKRKAAANEIIRTATNNRAETKKIVTGQQFHRGILMVDSSDNENSEIYGEKAKSIHAHTDYKSITHLERRANLSIHRSNAQTNGNIICPETIAPRVKIEKFYQSKGGDFHALSFDETHNRIFNRRGEKAPEALRCQNIRDNEMSGKGYNIVTHAMIEQIPSKNFERQYDSRMGHPSQNTLEGHRNFQGTLFPRNSL